MSPDQSHSVWLSAPGHLLYLNDRDYPGGSPVVGHEADPAYPADTPGSLILRPSCHMVRLLLTVEVGEVTPVADALVVYRGPFELPSGELRGVNTGWDPHPLSIELAPGVHDIVVQTLGGAEAAVLDEEYLNDDDADEPPQGPERWHVSFLT